MVIQNALVLNSETMTFQRRPVYMEKGRFTDTPAEAGETLDAGGLYAIPGFIDSHIHGFSGCDFGIPGTDLTPARQALARQGTTAFAATISTRPMADLCAAAAWAAKEADRDCKGAKLVAIHAEGPFISEKRKGAMIPTGEICTPEAVGQLINAAGGKLKLMTIAPERENSLEVIRRWKENITFSMGHTDATWAEATAAIDAGAARATHTFNGMRPLSHRETGILGAVLNDDRVCCEMICDFVHLDPPAVKLVYKMKGAEKITLISDTGYMGGLPDGVYRGRIVKDGVARTQAGVICGSCFTMLRGAQNLRKLGIPLAEISQMASLNPAKALGLQDTLGKIAPGYQADLILCDESLNIKAVFMNGRKVAL